MDANIKIRTFESAVYYIKRDLIAKRKPRVEYIEITEKDLDLPLREPNPPLLRP
jgi:hypothetical protein